MTFENAIGILTARTLQTNESMNKMLDVFPQKWFMAKKLLLHRELLFFRGAIPGLILLICVLLKHNFFRKTVSFSGIRTWIGGVEGDHADHLTTTTAPIENYASSYYVMDRWATVKISYHDEANEQLW